jgi:hypothetical protein
MFVPLIVLAAALAKAAPALASEAEYEAADQASSGIPIGPDRTPGTIAAEASGRRAVLLEKPEQSVQFTLQAPARGLTIRYSLPGAARRPSSTAVIEVSGRPVATATLTTRYSGGAHFSVDRPFNGPAHHFWDEERILLPMSLPAGTTVSIRMSRGSGESPFALDVIDTLAVPSPAPAPAGAISLQRFGADPSGKGGSRQAFIRAIAEARREHRPLYVPPGRYRVDGHLIVDRVAIIGAGSWYSIIAGHHFGFYSRRRGSSDVSLSALAVESDVYQRQDRLPLAAVGGRFSRSSFTGLYLHHSKVGMWLDGPAHDIAISGVEIADQAADGINLHRGIRDSVVENSRIRNVGDDGIASWSERVANERIRIRGNRIAAVGLANGIAVYGGRDIEITGNRIADTLIEGGGIHLGARFRSAPFSGTIRITNNAIVRSGSLDPHWRFGIGAIWLYALEKPVRARILIENNRIEAPTCEAIQLLGPKPIDGVRVEGLEIEGPVESVLALQTAGSLYAAGVVSDEAPLSPIVDVPHGFHLMTGPGNRAWETRAVASAGSPKCR